MKVLILITPEESTFYMNKHMPPLSVGVLQSYLRSKNHEVRSIDLSRNFKNIISKEGYKQWYKLFEKDEFYSLLEKKEYVNDHENLIMKLLPNVDFTGVDFVGISVGSGISIFEIHLSLLIGKYIDHKYNLPVAFGGVNIAHIYNFKEAFHELWMKIFINFKYFFVGAGEISFEKLLMECKNDSIEKVYKNLEGAIYLENNKIHANKESLPSLICPDFSGFNLSNYFTYSNPSDTKEIIEQNFSWPFPYNVFARDINNLKYKELNNNEIFFPYYFNYHCPYNCAFCGQSSRDKMGFCSKNAVTVLNDLEYLNKEFGAKYFHFVNNTFNYSPSFAKELTEGIINKNLEIYWDDCARINKLSQDLLKLMYTAGCRKLVFGFETGSKKLQDYINKKLDIDLLKQVLIWCHEIGILCDLEVIIGFPYESEDDFMDTYNFLFENRDHINYFYVNRYYVDPNSSMGTNPEKFKIQLRTIQDYSIILEKNKNLFKRRYKYEQIDIELSNLHIFSFHEINGRKWDEINNTINRWFTKMYALQQSLDSVKKAKKYFSLQYY